MITRIVLAAGAFVLLLTPGARADPCNPRVDFDRVFEQDVPGGYYLTGEDAQISVRFRDNPAGVVADFRVITPYRTKEFGSGVAFWVCDATRKMALRVSFGDMEGQETMALGVRKFRALGDSTETGELIFGRQLSLPKNDPGRVRIQKGAKGQLVVRVDGETFSFEPGFDLNSVVVQVYCSKSWVRFLDGDLVS